MDPSVSSPIAKRYGLHVSLLERLYDDDLYKSGKGLHCRSHLTENHRSHEKVQDDQFNSLSTTFVMIFIKYILSLQYY